MCTVSIFLMSYAEWRSICNTALAVLDAAPRASGIVSILLDNHIRNRVDCTLLLEAS